MILLNQMRKLPIYILIIIIFSLSTPLVKLNAEVLGTCILMESGVETKYINISSDSCDLLVKNQPTLRKKVSWTPNSTTPPIVVPPGPTGPANQTTNYVLLSPINVEGGITNFDSSKTNALGTYLNKMIQIVIGLAAVMAVVMIVIGGIEYMTSELISGKEAGKDRIQGALLGLLLALGAFTLLFTINPDLLNTDLKLPDATVEVTLANQIKTYSGQGKCEPTTDPSGLCSPSKLAAAGFPSGTQASSICNGESGGDPSLASGVDRCSDGNTAFSYGLFQINIIAHANQIPGGVCSNIFQVNGGGTQGACLESKDGICIKRNCSVNDPTKLQTCISYITNPANNIAYAKNLQAARDWGQWGAYNSCKSTFPPK